MSDNNIINLNFNRPALRREDVKTVSEIAGKNPPKLNLKDHPEVDGHSLYVFRATPREGDSKLGPWVLADALIVPPEVDIFSLTDEEQEEYRYTFMTGSENVFERIMKATSVNALPLVGTLRNEGQAWFLD